MVHCPNPKSWRDGRPSLFVTAFGDGGAIFFFTLRPWHDRLRHELLGRHPIPAHGFPLQFIARF